MTMEQLTCGVVGCDAAAAWRLVIVSPRPGIQSHQVLYCDAHATSVRALPRQRSTDQWTPIRVDAR